MKVILLWFIKIYQMILRPLLGPRCRFYPSCSEYAIESLQQHSLLFALWLVAKRLLKCQPLHPGGYDPVPTRTHQG